MELNDIHDVRWLKCIDNTRLEKEKKLYKYVIYSQNGRCHGAAELEKWTISAEN